MKWPTAIDLFSGMGGLSLGLRQSRYRVLGAVELDPLSAETYRENFPGVRLWEQDIRTLDPKRMMRDLELRPGELSLLAACPPCQGFSSIRARRRRTIRDKRNRLILEVLRFVRAFKPRAVVMENVPGLARYHLFQTFVSSLRSDGYVVDWAIHDAEDFGVPQRRARLLLMASKVGPVEFAAPLGVRKTVRQAIGDLPAVGESGDPLHDLEEHRSLRIIDLISRIPKDGGSRAALGADEQLACHQRLDGFKDVYGRMRWDDVAPTITGGCVNPSKGRFLHPEQDRAITLREALLLQAFPPDFVVPLSRGKLRAAELVGNALPPPLIAEHVRLLRPRLGVTPSQARHPG